MSSSIFLPKTSFPMRGNLPQNEPSFLELWKTLPSQVKNQSCDNSFVLHDGPPYANGHLHMGHALNKILKDVVNRIQGMRGKHVHYIPGWDCHGLPIESKVEENFRSQGKTKKEVEPLVFRQACREFAQEWINIQREEFKRLGIKGEWNTPYTTMSPGEEAGIVEAFLSIFMRGDVYRGVKPVLWSVVEETALAEAEVEYKDIQSSSIDVRFPIIESPHPELIGAGAIIWTTTPWTLPGNRAIAYAEDLTYLLIQCDDAMDAKMLIAEELVEAFCDRAQIKAHTVLKTYLGTQLSTTVAAHPFKGKGYDFSVPLLPGAHVTAVTGTGLVHTAPSHGVEDFAVGQAFGLEVPETVNASGIFEENVPIFAGQHVYKVAPLMIQTLQEVGALLSHHKLTHSYPHSWRSKTPLIYRATAQWFLAMDGKTHIRRHALEEIQNVRWLPESGQKRLEAMVENRPDWCLSRQRVWGVPIPLFLHKKTGEPLKDERVNARILDIMVQEGTDAWWKYGTQDFLDSFYNADDFEKTNDILDVWFDSGVTHEFVLPRHGLEYPADLYLEGSDQHRGWFQSSLLTAIALGKQAPYRSVLTHGFVVDGEGKKMSKSVGNIMAPQEIVSSKGADILRLWVVSADFSGDIRVGPDLLKHVEDLYRRIRNTFRYLLGALSDFSYEARVPFESMPDLERWIYHKLFLLNRHVNQAFDTYDFQPFLQEIHTFCTNDLSSFYFDVRKDALYCDAPDSLTRRATQTLMSDLVMMLTKTLAPVLAFTCEEVWQTILKEIPQVFTSQNNSLPLSVHQSLLSPLQEHWFCPELDDTYQKLRHVRQVVTGALERARSEKKIGSSLEAHPHVYLSSSYTLSEKVLEELTITSYLSIHANEDPPEEAFSNPSSSDISVVIQKAAGEKCERCWKMREEVTASHSLCARCQKAVTA